MGWKSSFWMTSANVTLPTNETIVVFLSDCSETLVRNHPGFGSVWHAEWRPHSFLCTNTGSLGKQPVGVEGWNWGYGFCFCFFFSCVVCSKASHTGGHLIDYSKNLCCLNRLGLPFLSLVDPELMDFPYTRGRYGHKLSEYLWWIRTYFYYYYYHYSFPPTETVYSPANQSNSSARSKCAFPM